MDENDTYIDAKALLDELDDTIKWYSDGSRPDPFGINTGVYVAMLAIRNAVSRTISNHRNKTP